MNRPFTSFVVFLMTRVIAAVCHNRQATEVNLQDRLSPAKLAEAQNTQPVRPATASDSVTGVFPGNCSMSSG